MNTAIYPEFTPSPGYRSFIERLRLARLERGLSIADMSDEVGLSFRLTYEFENLVAPLPFCHMRVWCDVVGVPFDDFLAIYWADEEAYAVAKEAREREAEQREIQAKAAREPEADQQALGITSTKAGETDVPTTDLSHSPLRAAFERIAPFSRSLFSTPKKTPE